MTEVLHANIFFIITSIAVVIFSLLVCVLLYHVIKIVKSVRRIVERVEAGSEVLAEDLEDIRASLNPARIFQFVLQFMPFDMPKSRSRRKKEEE